MKTTSILATLIGGAIIGSAATICMKKKSGQMHSGDVHRAIIEKLNFIQGHIDECCCMMGRCESTAKERQKSEQKDDAEATTK